MGLRVTTWNVNGIRNPFGYQPWSKKKTFDAMFDVLEADIVVMQELKIQRKDLKDDMVLVPGWDCFFSLPKHKKGYSGVGIYTRQSKCQPIRAEEGLLGVLCPPGSDIPYRELSEDESIGGYPSYGALVELDTDAAMLDSEGRCVVVEFPAFVIIGVYCPANTRADQAGDNFRHAFWNALDIRIRNLTAKGKRVILTGDLNNAVCEIDIAGSEADKEKEGVSHAEFVSTPNRRIFNQLLNSGEVFGRRDEGRQKPVMWDSTRAFHPERQGMYTHWDTKKNTRPGNFGSRIDYVLTSIDMESWCTDANIQEGLQGSDHCPVYATLGDVVTIDGEDVHLLDIMNPPGVFKDGKRLQEVPKKATIPFSARLLPEFNVGQRQNIKDMFKRQPSNVQATGVPAPKLGAAFSPAKRSDSQGAATTDPSTQTSTTSTSNTASPSKVVPVKRKPSETNGNGTKSKKAKQNGTTASPAGKPQGTLRAFFQPKAPPKMTYDGQEEEDDDDTRAAMAASLLDTTASTNHVIEDTEDIKDTSHPKGDSLHSKTPSATTPDPNDPIDDTEEAATTPDDAERPPPSPSSPADLSTSVEKRLNANAQWSSLMRKPKIPHCEDHDEPCKYFVTKKKGVNCGRAFYICARPLGPSGDKEKNTQWRCKTYIWASDWQGGREKGA